MAVLYYPQERRCDLEWWFQSGGTENMLKGVEGDETNPPRLTGDQITEFLQHIPQARASYSRIYPTLLPEEQARLDSIVDGSPSLEPLTPDTIADNFQHRLNTPRLQRGGGWAPPPFEG